MVEKWLIQVEEVMLLSLQKVAKEALKAYAETEREKWVQEWPGQVKIVLSLLFILFRNGSLVEKLLDTWGIIIRFGDDHGVVSWKVSLIKSLECSSNVLF